ncbi:MAG: ABC transporter substrate-binding protein [Oscillospiraceae bacterium]|jgi:putative ABC transport system substrate-binding protein|nr:ABC transporter substrate-binding protein [Oscillospiraceae bacterium]
MAKKILALLLAIALIATLAACSTNSSTNSTADSDSPAANDGDSTAEATTPPADGDGVFKIGIVQIVEHPSLNDVRTAMIEELAAQGFVDGDKITIDYQDAQGDQTNLNTIVQKFVSGNYDLIVAIATPSAQAAQGATDSIPIVFAAVTDPVGAGLVASLEAPGANITGTSDWISAAQLMGLATAITPNLKTIGAIYCLGEANSVSTVNDLKEWASDNGVEVVESAFVNSNEVQQATAALVGKVDAVFSPTDNTVASSMAIVADTLIEAKLPIFCGADSMVTDGGLASYGVNYPILGTETGKIVIDIIKGANAGEIPVKTMEQLDIYVNVTTADAIGANIPADILEKATKVE